jgi:CBS domain-containing protein
MGSELIEIKDFLAQHPPFEFLPEKEVAHAASRIEISYFRAGETILTYGAPLDHLYIVRSGLVELYRRNGDLYNRIDSGSIFGQFGLLMNRKVRFAAVAIRDTLVYCLPEEVFTEFCETHDEFSDYVEVESTTRLRLAVKDSDSLNVLETSKVTTLLGGEPIFLSKKASVQEVAMAMTEHNTSAVLITDELEQGAGQDANHCVGIATERDLCAKVLARGGSPETTIEEVMSTELVSIKHNAYAFEAMLTMLRYNIQHLPVMRDSCPIGIIQLSDIVRHESQSSLLLVNSIFQQNTMGDLATLSSQVQGCFTRMVNEDANSQMIGTAMAEIGRSFIQRIAELGEEWCGPPPVPYCFITLGSMARDELLIVTDQDNALILDDDYDQQAHGDYFERLAGFICDGLDACGYKFCTGDIMATNPEWRKTRSEWERCFADWIDTPEPQALLNASIFFDLDGVYGRTKWAEQLNGFISRRARRNNRFLACLARNALNRTPPLGFFKEFVLEKDGRQRKSMNLKRRGTAPLVDIVRVHALAIGSQHQNSFDRLADIIDSGILPMGRGPDLRDAMEFISIVRIRHQAHDVAAGEEPDNSIVPENLSDFEKRHLKDAFQILSNAQKFLKYRYQANRFDQSSQ